MNSRQQRPEVRLRGLPLRPSGAEEAFAGTMRGIFRVSAHHPFIRAGLLGGDAGSIRSG
jgi:hypothetical protein